MHLNSNMADGNVFASNATINNPRQYPVTSMHFNFCFLPISQIPLVGQSQSGNVKIVLFVEITVGMYVEFKKQQYNML